MTCRFAFGNISRTPSLLHNERFLKCRLTVLLIVEGTGWICACPRLVVWAVLERNRSETERSLRPLDKNPLRAPTIFRTLRSTLAPRSSPLTCSGTQYLVGAPFALITFLNSAWHGGDQFVALLRVVWKPRFLWQWPSAHLHCWVCVSHLPLDNTP